MSKHIELIHLPGYDPKYNMPYTAAIRVKRGDTFYFSGITAAPIYHSHPHVPEEFDHIPADPAEQTRMAMENLGAALRHCGGDFSDVVWMIKFIKDTKKNQNAIGRVINEYMGDHRPTSTSVEISDFTIDPRIVLEMTVIAVIDV